MGVINKEALDRFYFIIYIYVQALVISGASYLETMI